jgi:hypothetical protein
MRTAILTRDFTSEIFPKALPALGDDREQGEFLTSRIVIASMGRGTG